MKRVIITLSILSVLIVETFIQQAVATENQGNLIGPGDRIAVSIVVGGEPRHEIDTTVSPTGMINVPFLGEIKAVGLTYRQLEEAIRGPLAQDYYVDPVVSVTVETLHEDYREGFYIWGAVRKPGLIKMPFNKIRLLRLIVSAGGITADAGATVYIYRNAQDATAQVTSEEDLPPESQRMEVPLIQLLEHGESSLNPVVNPGDIVYIPFKETLIEKKQKIYIEGEIAKPGAYDYQEGITALKACIAAGGFSEYSAPNRAKIFRGSGVSVKTIKINLNRVQRGKTKDILLKPDDRIYIPQSWF